jgi:chromosome segregation ATPase
VSESVWVFFGAVALIVLQLVQAKSTTRTVKDQFNKVTAHVDNVAAKPTPEVQETNTLVKQLVDNQQTAAKGWEIAVQMVQVQNSQLTQQLMDLQRQNGEFKSRIDTYQGELDKLLGEQKERAKASRENQEQIGTLNQKMKDMEDTQARIAEELQKAQDALIETKRELELTRDSVARLEGELKAEREEKARITAERDAALKKVSELEERVRELERQVYDLEAKLGITHPTPILDPLAKNPMSLAHTPPLGTRSPFTTAVDDAGNIISSGTIPPMEGVQ